MTDEIIRIAYGNRLRELSNTFTKLHDCYQKTMPIFVNHRTRSAVTNEPG